VKDLALAELEFVDLRLERSFHRAPLCGGTVRGARRNRSRVMVSSPGIRSARVGGGVPFVKWMFRMI
jgi:hypothetical protein